MDCLGAARGEQYEKESKTAGYQVYCDSRHYFWCISTYICSDQITIGGRLSFFSFTEEQAGLVASMIEGAVGAIAAGFVLYELKLNADVEVRQNDIEEAQFLLEYNQAFIQDEKMCTVEHLLERWMESEPSERVEPLINDDNRQQFINYLVYLEGLATLVFRGILKLEHIDDFMAYRFFLAMNNKELQEDQLFRYADYYRGCFKLYALWKTYRTMQNHQTPLSEYALDLWDEFEKYSEAPVSVRKLSLEDNLKRLRDLFMIPIPLFIQPHLAADSTQ